MGLYGPDSMTWRIVREQVLLLASGRTILLETAHPFVAHAVGDHSRFARDPFGRARRTFTSVEQIVFGDLETALASARKVRRIHEMVTGKLPVQAGAFEAGQPYDANQQQGLLWVFATLIEGAVFAYELLVGRLSSEEKERYYEESKLFAYCFAIEPETLPPTWHDFYAYNVRMWHSDELHVGDTGKMIARQLLTPPHIALAPAARFGRTVTGVLLPEPVREQYAMPAGPAERALARGVIEWGRKTHPVLPGHLRYGPAYLNALWRLRGWPGSDPLGRAVERVFYPWRQAA